MPQVLQTIADMRQAGFVITVLRVFAKRRTVIIKAQFQANPPDFIALRYTTVQS